MNHYRWVLPLLLLPATSCGPMGRTEASHAAGWNGGFEVEAAGVPVNWMVYSPETVPNARFRVDLDRDERLEGEQSLRFSVEQCQDTGGWRSPGIGREWSRQAARNYTISFAIRSSGARWVASFGGVNAKQGSYQTVESGTRAPDQWHRVNLPIDLEEDHERLRFELSIRSPGDVWIDDIQVIPE